MREPKHTVTVSELSCKKLRRGWGTVKKDERDVRIKEK